MRKGTLITSAVVGACSLLVAGAGLALTGHSSAGAATAASSSSSSSSAARATPASKAAIEFHACVDGRRIRYDGRDARCPRGYTRINWFHGSAATADPVQQTAGLSGLAVQYITNSGQAGTVVKAQCPAGYPYVLGGGGLVTGANELDMSMPVNNGSTIAGNAPEGAGGGWAVNAAVANDADQLTAYAICAR
jgi:hypothetical protein